MKALSVNSSCRQGLCAAGALFLVLAMPRAVGAQGNPEPLGFKFDRGQAVQPIFAGWTRKPDGGYTMYFGYINRNYVETPAVPVGPDNKFEPGAPDRGQPTVFNTRIHTEAFHVDVPEDWGKKELVWTVTTHGKTERAVGWLEPGVGNRSRLSRQIAGRGVAQEHAAGLDSGQRGDGVGGSAARADRDGHR